MNEIEWVEAHMEQGHVVSGAWSIKPTPWLCSCGEEWTP